MGLLRHRDGLRARRVRTAEAANPGRHFSIHMEALPN